MIRQRIIRIISNSRRTQYALAIVAFGVSSAFLIFSSVLPLWQRLVGAPFLAAGWWLCESAADTERRKQELYESIQRLEQDQ